MLHQNPFNEKLIEEVIYKKLPEFIKTHPEVKKFLEELISEKCADKQKTEDRFEKLLLELKAQREESEKKWRELREESERKWQQAMNEIKQLREESDKKWQQAMNEIKQLREESEEKWQQAMKEIKQLREESEKKWRELKEESERKWRELKEESDKRWQQTLEEIKKLHRKYDTGVGALGARWGLQAESTFREAIKGILEESFPVKVERYWAKDEEGKVFGYPEQVEIDLIIHNGETIAAEIKSSISKAEMYAFARKVKFFEEQEGKSVKRKVVISPMVEPKAKEAAQKLNIEVYSYPEDFKE